MRNFPSFRHPTFPLNYNSRSSHSQLTFIMIALSLLSLLLAATALAAPARRDNTFHGACNVPPSAVTLASSFSPVSSSPNYALMGVGVQNYTCNSKGTYE